MQRWKDSQNSDDNDNRTDNEDTQADVSEVFFELANAPRVKYRVGCNSDGTEVAITIKQDVAGAAQQHTGGIVWETAFLLLEYLLSPVAESATDACHAKQGTDTTTSGTLTPPNVFYSIMDRFYNMAEKREKRHATVLELGAGCGMVGLALCKAMALNRGRNSISKDTDDEKYQMNNKFNVIVTETSEVVENLKRNCLANLGVGVMPTCTEAEVLDWTNYKEHCQRFSTGELGPGLVDMIVGTDVVFSTRFVEPMLQTMDYLSHDDTYAILCVQERCADAHALLLEKAKEYRFKIQDISEQVYDEYCSCAWGRDLDCKLLEFTRTKEVKASKKEGDNKRRKDSKKEKAPNKKHRQEP
jgi:predicted nicotinamide N-methyase